MPKANPKRDSVQKRYYQRARTSRASESHKDNTPVYFGLLFVGIIAGIILLVWAINQDFFSTGISVRNGDIVDIRYIGRHANGTKFDEGTLEDIEVGNNNLLEYFDQQLVGTTPGVMKSFVVPAEFGYTTPGDDLYGHDLHFQVTIVRLTRDGTQLFPEP